MIASTFMLLAAPSGALTYPISLPPSAQSVESPSMRPAVAETLAVEQENQSTAGPLPVPGVRSAKPASRNDEIVVTARRHTVAVDPLRAVNAQSFAVTQTVDRAFVGPLAMAYKKTLPTPVRDGLRNFLYNLHEPDVFVNFLLQIKPGKAAATLARFVVNSTIGGAGLVDVAKRKPFHLPRRRNGFADTFGFYGIKPGPFLFLPLIGPTTVRDLVGGGLDRFLLPFVVGAPFNKLAFTLPVGIVSTLDHRAEFDDQLHELHDESADPYAASRSFYLDRRQAEIDGLHGHFPPASPATIHGDEAPPSSNPPKTPSPAPSLPVSPEQIEGIVPASQPPAASPEH
jgi:phospholipid-binding lipoprotein MlaA